MSDELHPGERLEGEPDLDAPGEPIRLTNERGEVVHEVERTRREVLADIATAAGGIDNVTPEILLSNGFTDREFNYWVLKMVEEQRPRELELIALEARLGEKWAGANLEKDKFGLLRVKDEPKTDQPESEARPGTRRRGR
jgi:hypothetical protein